MSNSHNDTIRFEAIYQSTHAQHGIPPWSAMHPRTAFLQWAEQNALAGHGQQAAVIGCGLGDDAEELARRGFAVTAFDVAPTAIAWCQERFPRTVVNYQVADLFAPPKEWRRGFDFVLEIFTIQALPIDQRAATIAAVADLVAPGGRLFIFTLGTDVAQGPRHGPPWPVVKSELTNFANAGLMVHHFEDLRDIGDGPNLSFRAVYGREA